MNDELRKRKLRDGQEVTDAPQSVQMIIDSKCPNKWAFVDMETGDIWVYKGRKNVKYDFTFLAADEDAINCVKHILTNDSRYNPNTPDI